MAFDGELVLRGARQTVFRGDVFRCDAHVQCVEGIGQRTGQRIHYDLIAHL